MGVLQKVCKVVEEEKRGEVEEVERMWWTDIPKDVFSAGAGTMLSDVQLLILTDRILLGKGDEGLWIVAGNRHFCIYMCVCKTHVKVETESCIFINQ